MYNQEKTEFDLITENNIIKTLYKSLCVMKTVTTLTKDYDLKEISAYYLSKTEDSINTLLTIIENRKKCNTFNVNNYYEPLGYLKSLQDYLEQHKKIVKSKELKKVTNNVKKHINIVLLNY